MNSARIVLEQLAEDPAKLRKLAPPQRKRRKSRRMLFDRRKSHPEPAVFKGFMPNCGDEVNGFTDEEVIKSMVEREETAVQTTNAYHPAQFEELRCSSMSITNKGLIFTMVVAPMPKRKIRVLSMFDGIATGLYVLKRKLEIDVEVYYSCEIDEDARALQTKNFFGQLVALGSVKNLTEDMLNAIGPIDLLIGGTPCHEISLRNRFGKGIYDDSSSGHLFNDYVNVRNYLQARAVERGIFFFWFHENTSNMTLAHRAYMDDHLGCKPHVVCASEYMPMRRKRFYWTNIPFSKGPSTELVHVSKLQEILQPYRIAAVERVPTLTTAYHSQRSGREKRLPIMQEGKESPLSVLEEEILMGFEPHFTDDGSLSKRKRWVLLGRSWSVHVVTDILQPLKEFFLTK